jgi:ribonuclease R
MPENIVRAERNIAHRIIEEFMIATNEAVARHLKEQDHPLL